MTMQTSFGGADFAQTQWRAESIQLVNWGGFDGAHRIEFSPETTLLSGASGTGKSTILDAYLALMMDSNTPFNGASNDAVRGRVRGATQRSLLTYLRGKLDDLRTDGESTERVLRGANTATWGGIAVTFRNDTGAQYTVGQLYYVPRSAARAGAGGATVGGVVAGVPRSLSTPIPYPPWPSSLCQTSPRMSPPPCKETGLLDEWCISVESRPNCGMLGVPSAGDVAMSATKIPARGSVRLIGGLPTVHTRCLRGRHRLGPQLRSASRRRVELSFEGWVESE